MDNLINETNERILEIITNLEKIKTEYEVKIRKNAKTIEEEKVKAKKYKDNFVQAEAKIEKMNSDIEGFEEDYQNLVDKFKNDELANILVAANKEISSKIEERKRIIVRDRLAMKELVQKAENVKNKLVKLYAEKKVLEYCFEKIVDAHEFYTRALSQIVDYSDTNRENLCSFFDEGNFFTNSSTLQREPALVEEKIDSINEEDIVLDDDDNDLVEEPVVEEDITLDDDVDSVPVIEDIADKIDLTPEVEENDEKAEEENDDTEEAEDAGDTSIVIEEENNEDTKVEDEVVETHETHETTETTETKEVNKDDNIVTDDEDVSEEENKDTEYTDEETSYNLEFQNILDEIEEVSLDQIEDDNKELESEVIIPEDDDSYEFDEEMDLEKILNSDDDLDA